MLRTTDHPGPFDATALAREVRGSRPDRGDAVRFPLSREDCAHRRTRPAGTPEAA